MESIDDYERRDGVVLVTPLDGEGLSHRCLGEWRDNPTHSGHRRALELDQRETRRPARLLVCHRDSKSLNPVDS
jgi:hypothetical protein